MFVIVGQSSATALTSPDGITWTTRTLPKTSAWWACTYGAGRFVILSYGFTDTATSTDGITWSSGTCASASYWVNVRYSGVNFVAIGSSGACMTSPDGLTWTTQSAPGGSTPAWDQIEVVGGVVYICASVANTAAYSTNHGVTWTSFTIAVSGTITSAVTDGAGLFFLSSNTYFIGLNKAVNLSYNIATQFAVPPPSGQVGVKQYIKAL